MTGRTFGSAACAIWLGMAVGFCPAVASSAPLAMIDPDRPAPTIFDQALRDQDPVDAADDSASLPAELRRQVVAYPTHEAAGTIVIDTPHTYLYYYVLRQARRSATGSGVRARLWPGRRV